METRYNSEFNKLVQEIQQQFRCYKEKTSNRFQEIEKLIEVATMSLLKEKKLQRYRKAEHQEKGFVTPAGWKVNNIGHDRTMQQLGATHQMH